MTVAFDQASVLAREQQPAGVLTDSPEARHRFYSYAVVLGIVAIGSGYSAFWIYQHGLSWIEITGFFLLYFMAAVGQGIGLHRYFSHKCFQTSAAMRWLIALLATMSVQGPIVEWVADHRRHHAHSDECGDAHSPVIDNHCQPLASWKGLWHAQLGWLFTDTSSDLHIYAKDLLQDRTVMFFSRARLVWYFASIVVIPGLYGYGLGGAEHAAGSILIAGMLRTALFSQSVLALNSFGHTFGSIRFKVDDHSRNNALLAIVTLGEGWHNNHHRFPRNAYAGLAWYEIDVLGSTITLLEKLGLVWNVVRNARLNERLD
jgi:stearoyl-CoA desaturase (Delta-9 desaturase)